MASDPAYPQKLERIKKLRSDILNDLTNLSEDDIINAKGQLLSRYGLDPFGEIDDFISESIAEYLDGKPRETAKTVVNILLGKE